MRIVLFSIIVAAVIAVVPYAAYAHTAGAEGGLVGLHKLHKEKGRLCMADHDHFGQTGTWPTVEEARAGAVKSWAGFTRLEYGRDWAEFRIAAAPEFDCSPSNSSRGTGWTCTVKARPCRR